MAVTIGLTAFIVAWALAIFVVPNARFVIYAPSAKVGVEVILGITGLFAALVLGLFPSEGSRARLRWVSTGFLVMGIGVLLMGYVEPLLNRNPDPNTAMYGALIVRISSSALFAIGLFPRNEFRLSRRGTVLIVLAFFVLLSTTEWWRPYLPHLSNIDDLQALSSIESGTLQGLTFWHWLLSLVAVALAIAAAIGAARHYPGGVLGGWLAVAMTLQVGSLFHNLFWPTVYGAIFTTSSAIRIAFMTVVLAGSVMELRQIARERQAALAAQEEYARRLTELAILKADFTAMVAHEVSSPLAAIRMLSRILSLDGVPREQLAESAAAIDAEVGMLETLFRDVQMAATVEREDFSLQLRPIPLQTIFADAELFARTLPGEHPVRFDSVEDVRVMADSDRIGQVLRNLLSNAAKYSEPMAPIEVHAAGENGRVRIWVEDWGYGIHPDDMTRIFEKFGRGRDLSGQQQSGVGLGLYLSRRIARAHGSDITVQSTLGKGSVFSFELEIAQ